MQTQPPEHLTYEQTELLRIEADKLQEGMFVSKLDRPWSETPFVFQGFLLRNGQDVQIVQEYCQYVFIDVKRSIRFNPKLLNDADNPHDKKTAITGGRAFTPGFSAIQIDIADPPSKSSALKRMGRFFSRNKGAKTRNDFPKALKTSIENRVYTSTLIKSMMDEIRLGKSIDTPAAKEAVAACVDNVMMNQDASLLLTRLRDKDQYTSEHSLNVAIISIAFGRHIGMDREELNTLGLCGLLHDMGKMLTPLEILNKPGKLEAEEIKIMKRHPADGREILLGAREVNDTVIDVAFAHHERINGQGYPRGISNHQISLYTRMVTIADVYDAITGDRIYREGETAETALGILHRNAGTAFDEPLVLQFIQNIGTYPLGTIVEMTNGEIGIVVDNNPKRRLRPKIKLLLAPDGQIMEPRIIDLASGKATRAGKPYQIKTSHKLGAFGIDLSQHIGSYVKRI